MNKSNRTKIWIIIAAILFVAIVIMSQGMLGLYALVGISFTLSLMFPTIYGLALEGMPEEEAKIGAAGLVMAIVGGALMPTLQGTILDLGGSGLEDVLILGYGEINYSFLLPMVSFIVIALYARAATRTSIASGTMD
jgi:FHS family L-fucose permease-like MFS transporter